MSTRISECCIAVELWQHGEISGYVFRGLFVEHDLPTRSISWLCTAMLRILVYCLRPGYSRCITRLAFLAQAFCVEPLHCGLPAPMSFVANAPPPPGPPLATSLFLGFCLNPLSPAAVFTQESPHYCLTNCWGLSGRVALQTLPHGRNPRQLLGVLQISGEDFEIDRRVNSGESGQLMATRTMELHNVLNGDMAGKVEISVHNATEQPPSNDIGAQSGEEGRLGRTLS